MTATYQPMTGITAHDIQTERLRHYVLTAGPTDGVPVVFIHGNASSSIFWEATMLSLPDGYRAIAPDMRGYGFTEAQPIDATRGFGDWVDDFRALVQALGLERYHLVGHSLGGTFVFNWLAEQPGSVLSATAVCPGSPYGYGGCKGLDGALTWPDGAGSGGGVVNPDFARLMGEGYRGTEHDASPLNVMRQFYFKPPFIPEREEALLTSLLLQQTGPEAYPGDLTPSQNWPMAAPGKLGPINMVAPNYRGDSVERFIAAEPKPPVLWLRGSDDLIVSDHSMLEVGTLGKLGAIPGYPGEETYPPQPMVAQTRHVLEQYQQQGGRYREVVMEDTGHTPFIEQPTVFDQHFHAFLAEG